MMLRRITPADVAGLDREPVDPAAREVAREILHEVRGGGETALRAWSEKLGDLEPGARLFWSRADLERARDALDVRTRALLERTAARIESFARAQREALADVDLAIPGCVASHRFVPLASAGCYAPGGRHPLPSSVLMTALTAKVAGVERVWVASPKPAPATLAAAAIAGADGLLAAGGAQAIAALASGAGPLPACEAIVGPGNRFVTAAKELVSSRVAIDMLAGPSELVVVADGGADPACVAADLIAQAEHDEDALPILIALPGCDLGAVNDELERQLDGLSTAATACAAIGSGFCVAAADLEEAIDLCERLAPEHLQLCVGEAEAVASRLRRYGSLFVGELAAEVLGDYGAGPNHVLPTGGSARHQAGLSVSTFLRARTQLRISDPKAAQVLVDDAASLARVEGLEGHARAAELRHGGGRRASSFAG
ncbi:histidinol dehydrogenase [Engelhardtia mirabilis]|uniref:Histidinol dehydrogenase n=1 Tax=Engelhardtia mirabilis TaxID=2528011 RepID=A0A518BI11_9BACT|nr:Histidinol dehydrogenase [Planctomycetes bacterium Pla133]QDV00946.1 Histidinol dehydrogenase [Planctomycetes bacterium Pla86]